MYHIIKYHMYHNFLFSFHFFCLKNAFTGSYLLFKTFEISRFYELNSIVILFRIFPWQPWFSLLDIIHNLLNDWHFFTLSSLCIFIIYWMNESVNRLSIYCSFLYRRILWHCLLNSAFISGVTTELRTTVWRYNLDLKNMQLQLHGCNTVLILSSWNALKMHSLITIGFQQCVSPLADCTKLYM